MNEVCCDHAIGIRRLSVFNQERKHSCPSWSFLKVWRFLAEMQQSCSQQHPAHSRILSHFIFLSCTRRLYLVALFVCQCKSFSWTFLPTSLSRDCFYPPSIDSFSFGSSVARRQWLLRKTPILVAFAICLDKRSSTFLYQKKQNHSCSRSHLLTSRKAAAILTKSWKAATRTAYQWPRPEAFREERREGKSVLFSVTHSNSPQS